MDMKYEKDTNVEIIIIHIEYNLEDFSTTAIELQCVSYDCLAGQLRLGVVKVWNPLTSQQTKRQSMIT